MQALSAGPRPFLLLTLLCALLYLPGLAVMPPFDRDEARFAQASKQMRAENRWIVPYFQDAPRSKKPAGIYWLQAGSAALAEAVTGDSGVRRAIWAYRVPSMLGAWLAVLLTFALGRRLFDPPSALLGAALLGSSLLLAVEAHLAKTDAVLLATVLLALWGLARAIELRRAGGLARRSGTRPWLAFWGGLGLSSLIKGPIGPAVVALAVLGQRWASGTWRWGAFLRPARGVPLLAVLAGAWPLALVLSGAGSFMAESANEDLIPKLISAQESHGAPPGSYLAALYATFWPGALVVVPALVAAWMRRDHPGVRFCLGWAVPGWVMFALVPTKLAHYVLPLYPALALLAGYFLVHGWPEGRAAVGRSAVWRWLAGLHGVLWAALGLALGTAFIVLPGEFASSRGFWAYLQGAAMFLAVGVVAAVWFRGVPGRRAGPRLGGALVLAAVLTWPLLAQVYVPRLDHLWVARTVAEAMPQPAHRPPLAAAGYHEPSLVFLAGTETKLTSAEGVAAHLAGTPGAYGLIAESLKPAFDARMAHHGHSVRVREVLRFPAFNYSKGRRQTLILLLRPAGEAS
jgi:4-amino-4-deoxy-L-arabinose transferase-like glycosyltransferase